jgi:ABC-2 type transport system permease protein
MFQLLGRGVVPFVFGALVFPVALPTDVSTWGAFLVAVVLAMFVSFAIRFLVALSAFWFMDGTGVAQMSWLAAFFCSGMLLPLNVFPGALGEVVQALPWASLLQAPADVLLGQAEPLDTYAFQAVWAVALLAAGRLLQAVATRRVVVQGG